MQQGQQLLKSAASDVPARQQTLHQTIKWSYDLLDDEEQALFRHLSIFVGGCTLEAAAAVCQVLGETEGDILEGISSLLDKSLLRQVAEAHGAPRLQFLETIRAFGLECLVEAGESHIAQQAHASYFLRWTEAAEPELYGAAQVTWFDAATFTAAWTVGRTLAPEQAFAMRDIHPARPSPGPADELSARERDVLRLVAQGLTNAQIAARLVISPRTVNAHLRSIYNKLAVTSRTTATRYAITHQLI